MDCNAKSNSMHETDMLEKLNIFWSQLLAIEQSAGSTSPVQ